MAAPQPPQPPQLPGYTFRQYLGRGGFATVYLYDKEFPRRPVAVKVLHANAMDERQRLAFTTEANTMALLSDHPNIVQVLDAAVTPDGYPYLVMGYYPGDDLAQRVRRQALPLRDALSVGVLLGGAVESAHRVGVLHRDIKPSNVLISSTGAPLLSDFGIAGNVSTLHQETEVGVSIPWGAPEVVEGRSNGSARADVYSLAATVWHLLVGRPPFRLPDGDNSQAALIERVLRRPAPRTGLDVPDALERTLARALAKDPAARPATAAEFSEELQRIQSTLGHERTTFVVKNPQAPGVGPGLVAPPPEAPAGPGSTAPKAPAYLRPTAQTAVRPSSSSGTPSIHGYTAPAPSSGQRAGRVALIAAVVVIAGAAGTYLATRGGDPEPPPAIPTTPPSDVLVQPAPNAPDVADPVRRGDEWLFRWQPVEGAETYRYQDQGTNTIPVELPPGETRFRVPVAGGKRCYVVFAYSNVGAESAPSARRCTP